MVAVLYRNIKVSSLLYLLMHAAILSIDKIAHQTLSTMRFFFFIIGFERVIFSAYLLMRLMQSLIAEFAKLDLPLLEVEYTVGIF